jgi:hypothetical protein
MRRSNFVIVVRSCRSCSSCCLLLVRKSFRTFSTAESSRQAPRGGRKITPKLNGERAAPLYFSTARIVDRLICCRAAKAQLSSIFVRVDRKGKYRAAPCWIGDCPNYMPHMIANTTRRRQREKGHIQLRPKMKSSGRATSLATPAERDEPTSIQLLRRHVPMCSSRTTAQPIGGPGRPFLFFPQILFSSLCDYSCFAIDGRR